MIVFETVKKYLRALGYLDVKVPVWLQIIPIKAIQNCFVFLLFFIFVGPIVWFMVFDANNPEEFSLAFLNAVASIFFYGSYVAIILQKQRILGLIDDLEQIISKSSVIKFRFFKISIGYNFFFLLIGSENAAAANIYENGHCKVEKWTRKISNIWTWIINPCYVFPIPIFSMYKYYTSSHSSDSFELNTPVT